MCSLWRTVRHKNIKAATCSRWCHATKEQQICTQHYQIGRWQSAPGGKAKESLEQHQAKHRTREARQMCLRCQYHDNALKRQYPWSAERRTGLWAIGCVPCAMLLRTGKTNSVRFNKYARYQGLSDRHLLRSNRRGSTVVSAVAAAWHIN